MRLPEAATPSLVTNSKDTLKQLPCILRVCSNSRHELHLMTFILSTHHLDLQMQNLPQCQHVRG
jgi:hypothetical protein